MAANGEVKPGQKTTEFYMYLAAVILGGIVAAGVFDCDPKACIEAACYCPAWVPVASKIIGVITSILGVLGYGKNRSAVKAKAIEAAGLVESAKADPTKK